MTSKTAVKREDTRIVERGVSARMGNDYMNYSEVWNSDIPPLVVTRALHKSTDVVCQRYIRCYGRWYYVAMFVSIFLNIKRSNILFVNMALSAAFYKGDQRQSEFSVYARIDAGWVVSEQESNIQLIRRGE